jgi:AcrR family transcriptional regulator
MPDCQMNLRRPPKQGRSRLRVDEILDATKRLIGEKGIDAATMREIAAMTGGPISSIYQYFPNKSAIIATLHSRWAGEVLDMINEVLKPVRDVEALFAAATLIVDLYLKRILADPAMIDVVNAVQADKTLNNADISATREQSSAFCDVARPWIRSDQFDIFSRIAFLMFQLAGGAVRLALSMGGESGEAIIADYQTMIRTQLRHFIEPDSVGNDAEISRNLS